MSDKNKITKLRIFIYKSYGMYHAQGLEYDILAAAKERSDLRDVLQDTIDAEREVSIELNGAAFEGIPKAPQVFFDEFEKADKNNQWEVEV